MKHNTLRKSYLSYKQKVIDLNNHGHQYCLKCKRVMIYNKSNGVCFNCDTGV